MKKILSKFLCFFLVLVTISNIAVTPVYAAHTHKGVMCGKQLTWYEKKDGTYHTKVTANEDVCSCGEVIGTIDEVRKKEKHSFSGDTCTKCSYTKKHTHKGAMCGDKVTWYEQKNSTSHIYYTANENLCSCGEYLGLIDQTSKTQDHSFSGDTCTKCGYTRTHTHKGAMCGAHKTWYDNINANTHTYYTANENLCSCGAYLGLIDQTSTVQNHSFSGDTCTACGYTRAHVHQGVMCGQHLTWYEQRDASTHTYYTANENLCSCGANLGLIDQTSTVQNHDFDGDTCEDCGYTRAHVHKGVMCGQHITWYDDFTSTTHTYYTANEELCSCGEFLGYIDQTSTIQNHDFWGDTCEDCGYTREHKHKGVMCGDQVSWCESFTEDGHTIYSANEELCSCGAYLGLIDEKRSFEEHKYDANDVCVVCGYVYVHVHEGVMCGKFETWYEDITSTSHTYVTANENLCSCGANLGWIDVTKTTSSHDFYNDVCWECGYQRDHVHKGVMCGDQVKTLKSYDESSHTYTTANEELCSCGAYLGLIDEVETTSPHNFNGDTCSDCGYTRVHVHEGVMCGQQKSWYDKITQDTHTLYTANEALCRCGEVVGFCDQVTTEEGHVFVDGVCIGCGYQKGVDHIHVASICKNDGFTFYTHVDDFKHHRVVYEGDHLCACGEVVETGEYTTYEEGHTVENGKCIYCEAKVHEHKPSKKAETGTYYMYSDSKQHVKITINSGSYCSCGEFIAEAGDSVVYSNESHNFKDKKCTKCGYSTKSYGEVVVEQSILGDFSDDVNAGGVAGQIIIGEIPFVGTVADVRDLLASENAGDVLINLVGFIPLVGSLKYSDEVYTVVKHTDDIAGLIDNSDEIYMAAKAVMKNGDEVYAAGKVVEVSRVADNFDDGYDSFNAFKRSYGKAGDGYEWHHIVEQSQITRSGFDTKMINNGGNIIALDAATHRKVSGYYSRIVPGTGMTFRDWIAHKGFTYEQQQKIGEYVLEIYGVKVR